MISIQQRTSQMMSQTQKMSQAQIQAMNLLSMSADDLRNEIYEHAEKNPALEVIRDGFEASPEQPHARPSNSDDIRYGSVSVSQVQKSDEFQKALENNIDFREPLSSHLEHQLNSMKLSAEQFSLCVKIVQNLDSNGFHILSPYSFLKKDEPSQSDEFLQDCLFIVQNLDPVGCAVKDFNESLFVQACIKGGASEAALFVLDGNLEILNPPRPEKIQKKLFTMIKAGRLLGKISHEEYELCEEDFSDEEIEGILGYIKQLDPFPARNFGTEQANFIYPDVKVERLEDPEQGGTEFKVRMSRELLPALGISSEYKKILEEGNPDESENDGNEASERRKAQYRFVKNSVNEANVFIESILYRESTILNACREIVQVQKNFFETGINGNIVPFRQKDLAEKLNVHETTISRMANKKFLSCEWGIFPLSHFFSSAVLKTTSLTADSGIEGEGTEKQEAASDSAGQTSKEAVKHILKEILEAHAADKKPLSDQKLSVMLEERGIKIARRTVAKYRNELNMGSSYER